MADEEGIDAAGPFASSTDSFLDQPGSPNASTYPVNAGIDYLSSLRDWRYYRRDNFGETIALNTIASIPETTGADGGAIYEGALVWFAYQAFTDITFGFSYSVLTDGVSQQEDAYIEIFVDETTAFLDQDSQSGSPAGVSGTGSITLPAAVVPSRVQVFIATDTGGTAEWSFSFT